MFLMRHLSLIRYLKRPAAVSIAVSILALATGGCLSTMLSHDACGEATPPVDTSAPAHRLVKVLTEREGNSIRFLVENNEYCEITMTFEVTATNLKGPVDFPYTMSFPPRRVTEAFVLEPMDPKEKWNYAYTNHHKLGNHLARHDDSFLYVLPYSPGARFKVTQAYGGSFSHTGSNKYAIDWKMPEGTPVHAARGGEVVKLKHDSDIGGPSMKYDRYNNFVLIRHPDGTLGHYCHLLKGSVVVRVGDQVATGQMLARSGNTGFSSGPHLHFCVFRTRSGKERESIPVKFRTQTEVGTTLIAGRNYRATPSETVNASADVTAAGAGL
jgi:murein DD-endopeptidase MepM/ murein hydrolase activator NlpD